MFNSVPDIFSHYYQCLSESGIVILEITWCQALPLRSPKWNLRFGSCMSFSWNFGLSHIWFLGHILLLNWFLLFLTCFRHCSFLHACCLIVLWQFLNMRSVAGVLSSFLGLHNQAVPMLAYNCVWGWVEPSLPLFSC